MHDLRRLDFTIFIAAVLLYVGLWILGGYIREVGKKIVDAIDRTRDDAKMPEPRRALGQPAKQADGQFRGVVPTTTIDAIRQARNGGSLSARQRRAIVEYYEAVMRYTIDRIVERHGDTTVADHLRAAIGVER